MVRSRNKIKRSSFRQPAIYYKQPKRNQRQINYKKIFSKRSFCLLVLAAIFYFVFLSSYFKIQDVIVEGNQITDTKMIIGIMPKNKNLLLLKNKTMENEILTSFPEIKEVQIYKGLPNAIKVVVLEHDKSLIWQTGDKFYLVSSQGAVYKEVTDNITNYQDLPKVIDKKNIPVKIEQRILSPGFVYFALNIFKDFKEYTNLEPDYFWVDETTVDLTLQSKDKLYVKFDTMRSGKKQLDNLKNILVNKKAEITEYVDVRIDGWGYIK